MSWEMAKLGDIYSIKKGKKVEETPRFSDSIRYIQIDDLRNNDNIKYCADNRNYVVASSNDIIIAWDGANAGTCGYGIKGAIGSTLALLSTDRTDIDTNYVGAFLKTKFDYLRERCTGATIPHISRKSLEDIMIPLPDVSIQQQIASALDKATALIKKREEQIAILDKLILDTFIEMFGDPVTNPMGWDVQQLDNYISFMTSGSRGWAQYYSDEGEFFITIKNVKNGKLLCDDKQYVKAPNSKEAQRTKVQENDLLLSITADLGRTAIVDEETANNGAYINQHLCLIRLNCDKIVPKYLSYYLESAGGQLQFKRKDQVGVKSGLNFNAIKTLDILNPPIEIQREFANRIDIIEAQKSRLIASLAELKMIYKSTMQKAFNGELFN